MRLEHSINEKLIEEKFKSKIMDLSTNKDG